MSFNYWKEAVAESLDEHGVTATTEQIAAIAKDMEDARDSIGQAFYQPEDPAIRETARLESELKKERAKVGCRRCNGSGRIVESFGPCGRVSDSQCDKCHGYGKHAP